MGPSSRLPELDIQILSGAPPVQFDCGRNEQNEFLHRHALSDQEQLLSRTYLFHLDGIPAAFSTISMDSLLLGRDERLPEIRFAYVGAMKLAQLGVHASFQGRGVGIAAVSVMIELARDLAEEAGCRYVTVDAKRDLVAWYAQQGFQRNRMQQEQRIKSALTHSRDPEAIAVSMRFDLKYRW